MPITVRFQLGDDETELDVLSVTIHEGLCQLFEMDVEFLVPEEADFDGALHLGNTGLVTLVEDLTDEDVRVFHGVVGEVQRHGRNVLGRDRYRMVLRPRLADLDRRLQTRIFRDRATDDDAESEYTVAEVTQKILVELGLSEGEDFELPSTEDLPVRPYCVQWRETDLHFLQRLWAEGGIVSWFTHTSEGHKLLLGLDEAAHPPIDGEPVLSFSPTSMLTQEGICDVDCEVTMDHDGYAVRDWSWREPGAPLEAECFGEEGGEMVRYEYPGGFTTQGEGKVFAERQLEKISQRRCSLTGVSNSVRLAPGKRFFLVDALPATLNQEYLVLELTHRYDAHAEGVEAGSHQGQYRVEVRSQPWTGTAFVPDRLPSPLAHGLSNAVVTGPEGEEINVDNYGRVNVHFHWDRDGELDERASCRLRVQQTNVSGSMLLPRTGWEVGVRFLDGRPERPLVVQKHDNRDTLPPYQLPDHGAHFAIETSTYPGRTNRQGLHLSDESGAMQFHFAATRNAQVVVGHDAKIDVGANATYDVGGDYRALVGEDETVKVLANQDVTVNHNLTENTTLDKRITVASESWSVGSDATTHVEKNCEETFNGLLTVVTNDMTESFQANHERIVGAVHQQTVLAEVKETVGGKKAESSAAKFVSVDGGIKETFDSAKSFTTGLFKLKTGKDVALAAKTLFKTLVGSSSKHECGGAFTLSGQKVTVTATKAVIKGGSTKLDLKGANLAIDASSAAATGTLQLLVKGKINYTDS